jgi:hypothetical protein
MIGRSGSLGAGSSPAASSRPAAGAIPSERNTSGVMITACTRSGSSSFPDRLYVHGNQSAIAANDRLSALQSRKFGTDTLIEPPRPSLSARS